MSMPVIVTTSNNYLPALRPFAYLFNRYWSPAQSVVVVGFDLPDFDLPTNFTFVSLGSQANYPVNKWSDALIDFLHGYGRDYEHFVLMLEDYWLTRPVNLESIRMLYDYMRQFRMVIKMDLCADRLYAADMVDYDVCGYLDLVRSHPSSQYHMSLMTGIWNRELLLRYLLPGETPWDVELRGTPRLAKAGDSVLVLGTRQWPVRHILAHRGGDAAKYLLAGLRSHDINYLEQQGWLS